MLVCFENLNHPGSFLQGGKNYGVKHCTMHVVKAQSMQCFKDKLYLVFVHSEIYYTHKISVQCKEYGMHLHTGSLSIYRVSKKKLT